MAMRVFLRRLYVGIRRTDSRTIYSFKVDLPAADAEQLKLIDECMLIDPDADKRAQDHVATGAGKAIEIESLHSMVVSEARA